MDKKEKTIKEKINDWFADRDYQEGIELLESAAPTLRCMLKHLKRTENVENKEHLTYQLFKLSDFKDESICYLKKEKLLSDTKKKSQDNDKIFIGKNPTFVSENGVEGEFLAKIIAYQKVNYRARALAHKQMAELGDSNTDNVVAKRKELLAEIEVYTQIVDYIHNAKLEWQNNGVVPDISILEYKPKIEIEEKTELIVDAIADIDLQIELSKVRSRLSKYSNKMKLASGKKLEELKAKKEEDEKLKNELTVKINAVRGK